MTPGILQKAGAFDVMIERGFKCQLTEWRMTLFPGALYAATTGPSTSAIVLDCGKNDCMKSCLHTVIGAMAPVTFPSNERQNMDIILLFRDGMNETVRI